MGWLSFVPKFGRNHQGRILINIGEIHPDSAELSGFTASVVSAKCFTTKLTFTDRFHDNPWCRIHISWCNTQSSYCRAIGVGTQKRDGPVNWVATQRTISIWCPATGRVYDISSGKLMSVRCDCSVFQDIHFICKNNLRP